MTPATSERRAERVGIVGSGAVACGLAAVAARNGPVTLWARSDASAERAQEAVRKACAKSERASDAEHVTVSTDLGAGILDKTFVIEAITEDLEAKRDVLGRLEWRLHPRAILATTTSSLPLAELAEASGRPERFVAFHVFHPVPRMQLIELAFPARADQETRERARSLATALGKQPVEVPDCAGFVANRLLFPYLFDAVRLADERDIPAADVDTCMTLGAGHPMGPLALLDYVGLDVSLAIGESLGLEVPERVRDLVAEGALGRKAGRGFHVYD